MAIGMLREICIGSGTLFDFFTKVSDHSLYGPLCIVDLQSSLQDFGSNVKKCMDR
jgi:hypothetical protein